MSDCNVCSKKACYRDLITNTVYCSNKCFLIGDPLVPVDTMITLVTKKGSVVDKTYKIPFYNAIAFSETLENYYGKESNQANMDEIFDLNYIATSYAMDLLMQHFLASTPNEVIAKQIEYLPSEQKKEVVDAISGLKLKYLLNILDDETKQLTIYSPFDDDSVALSNLLMIAYMLDFKSLVAFHSVNKRLERKIQSDTQFKINYVDFHTNDAAPFYKRKAFIDQFTTLFTDPTKKRIAKIWLLDENKRVVLFSNKTDKPSYQDGGKYNFMYFILGNLRVDYSSLEWIDYRRAKDVYIRFHRNHILDPRILPYERLKQTNFHPDKVDHYTYNGTDVYLSDEEYEEFIPDVELYFNNAIAEQWESMVHKTLYKR